DITVLRDLRDGVDLPAVARDRDEIRRRGKVPVPHVVAEALEMPDALAGARVEREDAVREEIVAVTRDAVEIERRGSGRCEDHRVLLIDGHAGPRIRAAFDRVRIGRPRVVAALAGLRN